MHFPRGCRGAGRERLDVAQLRRNLGVRGSRGSDAQRREMFGMRPGDCLPVVAERVDAEGFAFGEWSHRELHAISGSKKDLAHRHGHVNQAAVRPDEGE